jgi:hypothetical protein
MMAFVSAWYFSSLSPPKKPARACERPRARAVVVSHRIARSAVESFVAALARARRRVPASPRVAAARAEPSR